MTTSKLALGKGNGLVASRVSKAHRGGVRLRDGDAVIVDAVHRATGVVGEAHRGAAGAAGNIEHAAMRIDVQPFDEAQLFVGGQPAVLAEVVAERFRAHLPVDLGGEVLVGGIVESDHV